MVHRKVVYVLSQNKKYSQEIEVKVFSLLKVQMKTGVENRVVQKPRILQRKSMLNLNSFQNSFRAFLKQKTVFLH